MVILPSGKGPAKQTKMRIRITTYEKLHPRMAGGLLGRSLIAALVCAGAVALPGSCDLRSGFPAQINGAALPGLGVGAVDRAGGGGGLSDGAAMAEERRLPGDFPTAGRGKIRASEPLHCGLSGHVLGDLYRGVTLSIFAMAGFPPDRESGGSMGVDGSGGATALPSQRPAPQRNDADRLVEILRGQLGVKEKPLGSNRGPEVDEYNTTAKSYLGAPWCASVATWAFVQIGYDAEDVGNAYSPSWFPASRTVSRDDVRPGDQGGVYFTSKGRIAHLVTVEEVRRSEVVTLEGNTNAMGSREGHQFARRIRGRDALRYSRWFRNNGKQASRRDDEVRVVASSSQPTLDEQVPKQLRAAGQAVAGNQVALVTARNSSAFPAAGCDVMRSLPNVLAEKAGRSVGSMQLFNDFVGTGRGWQQPQDNSLTMAMANAASLIARRAPARADDAHANPIHNGCKAAADRHKAKPVDAPASAIFLGRTGRMFLTGLRNQLTHTTKGGLAGGPRDARVPECTAV